MILKVTKITDQAYCLKIMKYEVVCSHKIKTADGYTQGGELSWLSGDDPVPGS